MRSSSDPARAGARLIRPLQDLIGAARRERSWVLASLGLAAFYVLFLAGAKLTSRSVVDSFFDALPARAAANPAVGLPLCLDFTAAQTIPPAGLFGVGVFEGWGPPGRWMVGPVAGLAARVPEGSGDLVLVVRGGTVLTAARPRVAYQLLVNGEAVGEGVLTEGSERLAVRVPVPAALAARRSPLLVEMRTPDAVSIEGNWRRLGFSFSAIHLFRTEGPACPEPAG